MIQHSTALSLLFLVAVEESCHVAFYLVAASRGSLGLTPAPLPRKLHKKLQTCHRVNMAHLPTQSEESTCHADQRHIVIAAGGGFGLAQSVQ